MFVLHQPPAESALTAAVRVFGLFQSIDRNNSEDERTHKHSEL